MLLLPNKKETIPQLLMLILGISLVVFNVVRILNVPVTHDEGWSYIEYILSTYRNIRVNSPISANNHILNSLTTKFFIGLFNSHSQLILRLTNLMAQVGYLFFSYQLLCKLFSNKWWVFGVFVLLNLNPFLFDFWGLCRGYGLALGFMMASLFCFISYLDNSKVHILWFSLVSAALATYSNLSMLNFYLALCAVVIVRALFLKNVSHKRIVIATAVPILIVTTLLYALIAQPVRELKEHGELYFGGWTGFVPDTVRSLIIETFFLDSGSYFWILPLAYIVAILAVVPGMFLLIKGMRQKGNYDLRATWIWLLMIIPAIATIAQHYLLGNLFLIERTAIFFYPLFIVHLACVIYFIRGVYLKHITLGFLTLIFAVNFVVNGNITYARSWGHDQYNMMVIDRMLNGNDKRPLKVRLYWMFTPAFLYYQNARYQSEFAYIERRFEDPAPAQSYDYYYIHMDDLATVPVNYRVDTSFVGGKYVLLKRN